MLHSPFRRFVTWSFRNRDTNVYSPPETAPPPNYEAWQRRGRPVGRFRHAPRRLFIAIDSLPSTTPPVSGRLTRNKILKRFRTARTGLYVPGFIPAEGTDPRNAFLQFAGAGAFSFSVMSTHAIGGAGSGEGSMTAAVGSLRTSEILFGGGGAFSFTRSTDRTRTVEFAGGSASRVVAVNESSRAADVVFAGSGGLSNMTRSEHASGAQIVGGGRISVTSLNYAAVDQNGAVPMGADLTEFLTEFAVQAIFAGVITVVGIFDNEYTDPAHVAGRRPTFRCVEASVPQPVGKSLQIGSHLYFIANAEPDGHGMVTLQLKAV